MPQFFPVFFQKLGAAAATACDRFDPYVPRLLKSKWTLAAVCALAVVLRMAVALVFRGFEHPDEIYQILEQAHRFVFGNGFITWEIDEGVRSYIWPGLVAGIYRVAEALRPGSYLVATRLALSLFSLVEIWFAWAILRSFASERAALIGAFLSAVWFELVFFGPKAHAEVLGTHILLIGTYLVFPYFQGLRPARLILGGALLGLAFCLRIQMALVMAVLWLTLLAVNGWRRVIYTTLGAAVGVALAGFVDYLTLPYPFASIIGYYKINIFEHVSTVFGRAPWYFMLAGFPRAWSGALVPFIWFGIEGARKNKPMRLLVWMAAGLILAHSLVAHKEYRYIYPALPLLLIVVAAGMDRVIERLYPAGARTLAAILAGIAILSLVVGVGGNYRAHFWHRYGETRAFETIRDAPDACGVILHRTKWGETPGYTVLHRNLPLYYADSESDLERIREAGNYIVSQVPETGYTRVHVWKEGDDPVYLYRREGGCTNRFLSERLLIDKRALWPHKPQ